MTGIDPLKQNHFEMKEDQYTPCEAIVILDGGNGVCHGGHLLSRRPRVPKDFLASVLFGDPPYCVTSPPNNFEKPLVGFFVRRQHD